jgi:hypothetical protein
MKKGYLEVIGVAAFCLALIVLLAATPAVRAAADALALDWWKVAGGGGDSLGGSYRLQGTVGQSEPGIVAGGIYRLEGGFWYAQAENHRIFVPLVKK